MVLHEVLSVFGRMKSGSSSIAVLNPACIERKASYFGVSSVS